MGMILNSTTFDRLVVLPLTWDEIDVRAGIVAREWEIDGIIDRSDVVAIQALFSSWKSAKALEPSAGASGEIGTTVLFSGAAAGLTWTTVPCWFSSAPSTPRIGGKYRCNFRLIDAQQALAAELLQSERSRDSELTYGTITVGGVTLILLEQPEGFTDGPTVELSAAGMDVIKGPLVAREVLQLRGYTINASDWNTIKNWYKTAVASTPVSGDWFPVSEPRMTKTVVAAGGNLVTRYMIDLDLRLMP